jgi:hypothetical protein
MPRHVQNLQSCVFWKFSAAGFCPFGGRELGDQLIGCSGQAGQDIAQVDLGVDAIEVVRWKSCKELIVFRSSQAEELCLTKVIL